ncbi:hypothetical protein N336_03527, partial [Phalacrocorax carbo]
PAEKFLVRCRQDNQLKSCWHCQAEIESCAHIIGYCPAVQEAQIKRHNHLCEMLSVEAKKKDWVVFQKQLLKDKQIPDLVLVKDTQALVVDVTIQYEGKPTSLPDAVMEKVRKYQHLQQQVQELTNANIIKFIGVPFGAQGKWHLDNYELLKELGLSNS